MFKGPLRNFARQISARPWLLYSAIGLVWGLVVLSTLLVRQKIYLNQWPLHHSLAYPGDALDYFEKLSIDWRFTFRGAEKATDEIIILKIDNDSMLGTSGILGEENFKNDPDLKLLEKWPYPREAWAKIIDKLVAAGVKIIGIDVVFAQASLYGEKDDLILQKALVAHQDKLVLAGNYRPQNIESRELQDFLRPNDLLIEPFDDITSLVGVVNYDPMERSVIRTSTTQFPIDFGTAGKVRFSSFSALTAQKAGYNPTPKAEEFYINFVGPQESFQSISLYKIFSSANWKGWLNAEGKKEGGTLEEGRIFKDKIVLIGATASILQDFHATPFGTMPGVEVHANALSDFFARPKLALFDSWFAVLLVGALQGFFISFFGRPLTKIIPGVLFILIIGGVSQFAFTHWHLITPLFTPWIISALTSVSITTWQAATEFLARQRTRKTLETYVSPNVAEFVLEHQDAYEAAQAGQRKPCTILFSDIRGFTTMTENSADETKLVEHLNEYLTEMVHCVFEYGGTLHKFIGDAVMAVWGDTHSDGAKADALAAVMTTLAMRRQLAQLNEKWIQEGKSTLKIGIGLNHGTVVVGAIGSLESPQRLEFTVIGDAVNVASRVESATKDQAVDILISKSVYDLVREDIEAESRGAITLKGKAEKAELFYLKGLRTR
jgi:adenylate cyclase